MEIICQRSGGYVNIVVFQWKKYTSPTFLPNTLTSYDYDSKYVNSNYENIGRVLSIPFKYYCISDDPAGLSSEIEYIPLWDYLKEVGGCARRMYIYSQKMSELIGDKFFFADLDFLYVSDFSSLYDTDKDLKLIQEKNPQNPKEYPFRYHPTGVVNSGAAKELWDSFTTGDVVDNLKESRKYFTGSDQSWINYYIRVIKKNNFSIEAMGKDEGIYNFRMDHMEPGQKDLYINAKIIDFAGPRDPRDFIKQYPWIKDFL